MDRKYQHKKLHRLCHATGRKEEGANPFATIDWVAYQGAPPEGFAGTVKLQKWWSGTNCADVTFPTVRD